MFQTLRARLIAICVAITVFSLLTLALATFFMVRKDTLTQLDYRVGQVTRSHANELAEWVREKQRITGSLKLAVGQAEPLPVLRAAKQAGHAQHHRARVKDHARYQHHRGEHAHHADAAKDQP